MRSPAARPAGQPPSVATAGGQIATFQAISAPRPTTSPVATTRGGSAVARRLAGRLALRSLVSGPLVRRLVLWTPARASPDGGYPDPERDEDDRVEEGVVVIDGQGRHRREAGRPEGQDDPAEQERRRQPAGRRPLPPVGLAGAPGQASRHKHPGDYAHHEAQPGRRPRVDEQAGQGPGEDPQPHEQQPGRERQRHAGPTRGDEGERGPALGEVVGQLVDREWQVADEDDRNAGRSRPDEPTTLGAAATTLATRRPTGRPPAAGGRSRGRGIAS